MSVDIDPLEVSSSCDRIRWAIADVAQSELQPTLTVTVSVSFAHFDEASEEVWELVKVVRQMDMLEAELAVRLFHRSSRRLLLTMPGRNFCCARRPSSPSATKQRLR